MGRERDKTVWEVERVCALLCMHVYMYMYDAHRTNRFQQSSYLRACTHNIPLSFPQLPSSLPALSLTPCLPLSLIQTRMQSRGLEGRQPRQRSNHLRCQTRCINGRRGPMTPPIRSLRRLVIPWNVPRQRGPNLTVSSSCSSCFPFSSSISFSFVACISSSCT